MIGAEEGNSTFVSDFPYGAFEVNDSTSAGYLLTIPLPPPFELNYSLQLNEQSVEAVRHNIAVVLLQLNVAEEIILTKIEEGALLINSTVMELLTQDSSDPSVMIKARQNGNGIDGFLRGLGDAASGVGCAAYAAGGVPAFLAAAAIFEGQNSRSQRITTDQDFFAHAPYGDTASSGRCECLMLPKKSDGRTSISTSLLQCEICPRLR